MPVTMDARYATLQDMAEILKDQNARRIDLVTPGHQLHSVGGQIIIPSGVTVMDETGVTNAGGAYRLTDTAVGHLSDRLKIDLRYLRRIHAERPDLFDANVNGWFQGLVTRDGNPERDWDLPNGRTVYPKDERKHLVRLFRGDNADDGIMRGFLSSRFFAVDNLDVLLAVLQGIREAGLEIGEDGVQVDGCDLTERRMFVRIVAPQIKALAPTLLDGYRNPFGPNGQLRGGHLGANVQRIRQIAEREGQAHERGQEPVMFAGFVVTNSETGDGKFSIIPRIVAEICRNGYTITADAFSRNHLGVEQSVGVVDYAADTKRAALTLVAKQARDAVAKFLSPEYLTDAVANLEREAGVEVAQPQETIKAVVTDSLFSEELADEILGAFISQGQPTAAGVANAATAVAQMVPDPEVAARLEAEAGNMLRKVAVLSR